MFDINDMRSNLSLGGARSNKFIVQVTNPVDTSGDQKFMFSCRSASIPAFTLGMVPVPYFGRNIKLPGDREFEDWTVAVLMDNDYLVRDKLEKWNQAMNSIQGNVNVLGNSPILYKSQGTITKFDLAGNPIRTYTVDGIWPRVIGATELDWEEQTQIETLSVTFCMDDFFASGGTTGQGGAI